MYCSPFDANVEGGSPLNVPHLETPEKGVDVVLPPVILPDKLGIPPIEVFIFKVPGQVDNFGQQAHQ